MPHDESDGRDRDQTQSNHSPPSKGFNNRSRTDSGAEADYLFFAPPWRGDAVLLSGVRVVVFPRPLTLFPAAPHRPWPAGRGDVAGVRRSGASAGDRRTGPAAAESAQPDAPSFYSRESSPIIDSKSAASARKLFVMVSVRQDKSRTPLVTDRSHRDFGIGIGTTPQTPTKLPVKGSADVLALCFAASTVVVVEPCNDKCRARRAADFRRFSAFHRAGARARNG